MWQRVAAARRDGADDLVGLLRRAFRVDHHRRASRHQLERNRTTDVAGGARDDGDVAGQCATQVTALATLPIPGLSATAMSGRMKKARTIPNTRKPSERKNGGRKLPVRSVTKPKAAGERRAAKPATVLMRAPATPA